MRLGGPLEATGGCVFAWRGPGWPTEGVWWVAVLNGLVVVGRLGWRALEEAWSGLPEASGGVGVAIGRGWQ